MNLEDKIEHTTIGIIGNATAKTNPALRPKTDNRKPVEVRYQGKIVKSALGVFYLACEYERPIEFRTYDLHHMVDSEVEVVIRQIPISPAAAH